MTEASLHAIDRYKQRVSNVPRRNEAEAILRHMWDNGPKTQHRGKTLCTVPGMRLVGYQSGRKTVIATVIVDSRICA
jgi:hypothetical protein